ncbi:ABC transporter permease [Chitinophaga alhagiae]|uniref:ABC transporter permease n=1 Tax=Chitinophaga alhagiae TaxID=2203219 RepID=UPI000E5B112C|nr:ABC transporter permease [Chitinophaga alhagiae]
MVSNYIKIAFRNLWKHKIFSAINIAGLAAGLTACFFILSYVHFELSYDDFHSKADRIVRLSDDVITPTETIANGISVFPAGPAIAQEFPEVETFARTAVTELILTHEDKKFIVPNCLLADSAFFSMFDFRLLQGNAASVLARPYTAVLSVATARKLFGHADPMGKAFKVPLEDTTALVTVTGVMDAFPENSQLKADVVVSMSTMSALYANSMTNWTNHSPYTYLLLKPGTDYKTLEAKFPAFLERRIGEMMDKYQMHYTYRLMPLKDVYLNWGYRAYAGITGNKGNVRIFTVVALMILLIACFNFINLSTARAAERAREVGVRKVAGAGQRQLVMQYLGESVMLCLFAFVLSVVLCMLLSPLFNQLAGKTIFHRSLLGNMALLYLFLGAVVTGLLAGTYPAWVLSSFRPVKVLKGRFTTGKSGVSMRKGLVVAQFTISLALIIATIVVYKQMRFMQQQDLGFQPDQTIVVTTGVIPGAESFRHAVRELPGVLSATRSSSAPGRDHTSAYSEMENVHGDFQQSNIDLYFVDFDFIPQYQLKLAAGRAFSTAFSTDSTQAMMLNEAAVKMLGYASPEAAIGRRFKQWGREGKVIGVLKDFHYHSLQQQIQPLTMRIEPGSWALLSVKVEAARFAETLAAVEQTWNRQIAGRPFDYRLLDEGFNRQYQQDERFGSLFFYFSILAIFISCLGLLGLVAYSTLRRAKEIGIRKVLGASASSVMLLLSREFIVLIGIAAVIAIPLVWYGMQQWLNGYAYRTSLSWWVFALAGVFTLVVALATVSFHSLKAAFTNPVRSLQTE